MKINIHAGHNADGKVACGACTKLGKESTQARKVVSQIIKELEKKNVTVYNCTVDDAKDEKDNLVKIVENCNFNKVDYDISIHFNVISSTVRKIDGKSTGVECFVYGTNNKATNMAKRVCKNISGLGFTDRGVKVDKKLYVLRNTVSPAILVECCFLDDPDDMELYNPSTMGKAIANALLEELKKETVFEVSVKTSNKAEATKLQKELSKNYKNVVIKEV